MVRPVRTRRSAMFLLLFLALAHFFLLLSFPAFHCIFFAYEKLDSKHACPFNFRHESRRRRRAILKAAARFAEGFLGSVRIRDWWRKMHRRETHQGLLGAPKAGSAMAAKTGGRRQEARLRLR